MAKGDDVKKAYVNHLGAQGRAYSLDSDDSDLNFIKDWLRENSSMSFKEKLRTGKVINYPKVTEEEIICWADRVDFTALSMSMNIDSFSEDFFKSFEWELNWSMISSNKTINIEFVKRFIDYLVPAYLLNNMSINFENDEDFMRELIERQRAILNNNAYLMSDHELHSSLKSFFNTISSSRNLSEEFIRDYHEELEWKHISFRQELSLEFLLEFKDRVIWDNVIKNTKIEEEAKYKCLMEHSALSNAQEWSRWKIMKDNYEIKNGLLDNGKKMV